MVLLFYAVPHKYRWILLLGASYFFYGFWKPAYLALIAISTVTDFWVSNSIYTTTSKWAKKGLLGISLFVNLGLLFLFKYLHLFISPEELLGMQAAGDTGFIHKQLQATMYWVIPVGISFYTFQTLSYTLDVYWKKTKPEKHLGKFALFVSFFPQLVAGPIERFSRLSPQLSNKVRFNYQNFSHGFRLIIFGFFLKLCIADNLALVVNPVYDTPVKYDALSIALGTLLFGFQIYTDFAGYSLIAQGVARLIGVRLMDNFRTPYLSTNIGEFWKRWHISLSTWFKDYLYIPLGGNRKNWFRWAINIMLVFAISGFWHGAQWTFMIWGALHGLYYLAERFTGFIKLGFLNKGVLGGVKTFVLVMVAWVFFRAGNWDNVMNIYKEFRWGLGTEQLEFVNYFWFLALLFILSEILLYNKRFDLWCENKHITVRWGIYALLVFCVVALGGTANHPFIYFQF